MNILDLGCATLETPHLKVFMDAFGLLGRDLTAPVIGAALFVYGRLKKDAKTRTLGVALLLACVATALFVHVLKIALQLPRPTPRSGYGFPSGDSAIAFTLASSLGVGFPSATPLFFLCATLAALSRLYFRAHFVWDVVGGALVGTVCGRYAAKRLLSNARVPRVCRTGWLLWVTTATLAAAASAFFLALESRIASHKRPPVSFALAIPEMEIDFGAPVAQPYLGNGWSVHKRWRNPALTINWVEGPHALVELPVRAPQDHLLSFHAYPYRPTGFVCQRSDLALNGRRVASVYLEQDWNTYVVRLPGHLLVHGKNRLEFRFPYSSTLDWHGINPERKPLSVAFDTLRLFPANVR